MSAYTSLLERLAGVRIMLVTGDAEGKGETAIGLATTAAATGKRTVLLECDLATPRFAEWLGLAIAPGLTEYLRGEVEATRILKPVVLAGPGSVGATEPLVCVVAGRRAHDNIALLASERLRRALEQVRSTYDLVVVNGPPPDDERALAAIQAEVDMTLACVNRAGSRRLDWPVAGVVIRG